MRGRFSLLGAALFVLVGCTPEPGVTRDTVPTPRVVDLPAAAAGGACRLLDFDTIQRITGIRFDVSAASQHQRTQTCVIRAEASERPDLVLSVTKNKTDKSVFTEEMIPSGGRRIDGLGKAAYRLIVAPGRGYGPGVELGWLTADGEVVNLRYTFAAGQDRVVAEIFASRLTQLAKEIRP